MARVIGQSKEKQCICNHCGARIEFFQKDILRYMSSDYSGSKDVVTYIMCPQCTTEINVDWYSAPPL